MSNRNLTKIKNLNKQEDKIIEKAQKAAQPTKKKVKQTNVPKQKTPPTAKPKRPQNLKGNADGRATITPSLDVVPPDVRNGRNNDENFSRFTVNSSPYIQSVQRPALVHGAGVPLGTYASVKWSTSYRIDAKTDSAGNFFFSLGFGRVSDGAMHFSLTNAASLVPNNIQANDTGGTPRTFNRAIGCMLSPGHTLDTTDVFKSTEIETLFLPSSADTYYQTQESVRLVSGCFSLTPLGNVSSAQGSYFFGQVDRDFFGPDQSLNTLPLQETFLNENGTIAMPGNRLSGGTVTWKPLDERDLQYTSYAAVFTTIDGNTDPLSGGLWMATSGAQGDMDMQLTIHLNYEGVPKDSAFSPGLTGGRDDSMELSLAMEMLAVMPMFSPTVYNVVDGAASGNASKNLMIHQAPFWRLSAVKDATYVVHDAGKVVKRYGGLPHASSVPVDGGRSGFQWKPFVTRLMTDYLPTILKASSFILPLL